MYVLEEDQDTNALDFKDPITDISGMLEHADGPPAADEQAQNVYHIYVVKDDPQSPTVDEAPPPAPRKKKPVLFLIALGIIIMATLSGLAAGVVFFIPPVTITIIPKQQAIMTTSIVTLVSGAPNAPNHIQGRKLATTTMSQQQTVKTTGRGHQEAQAAHGVITLFNAAPYSQVIAAGTLMIAAHGVQVVIDHDVVIPAANLPLTGTATVSTHALEPGPGGNIAALTINTACCRANMFARNNQAFTGGQNARDFPMVTQHDLDSVATAIKTDLLHSIQAALLTQVKASETLVTPIYCLPTVTTDHPVSTEATMLTVTVSETCQPIAYDTATLQAAITKLQTQESSKQLGAGYVLTGQVQTAVTNIAQAKHGLLTLTVEGKGVWSYQFDQDQLQQISHQVTGKTRDQTIHLLLRLPGVSRVSFAENLSTLPNDPEKIHVVVMYPVDQ